MLSACWLHGRMTFPTGRVGRLEGWVHECPRLYQALPFPGHSLPLPLRRLGLGPLGTSGWAEPRHL